MNYIENLLTHWVAKALLATGQKITVCGEGGYDPDAKSFQTTGRTSTAVIKALVAEANKFDEVHLFVGGDYKTGYGPWVYLIFGNGNGGWDMISDWITSLDSELRPVLNFIEKEGD